MITTTLENLLIELQNASAIINQVLKVPADIFILILIEPDFCPTIFIIRHHRLKISLCTLSALYRRTHKFYPLLFCVSFSCPDDVYWLSTVNVIIYIFVFIFFMSS